MNKKKFLLTFFFVALAFVPAVKVSATNTYVGVQITSTTPANGSNQPAPGVNWCLPIGTQMGISAGSTYGTPLTAVSPTLNPLTTTAISCPGNTIWSGLVPITSGSTYTIRLDPGYLNSGYGEFCSGYYDPNTGYCQETLDVVGENQNCTQVCANYGQTTSTSAGNCYSYFSAGEACSIIAILKGSACTGCTATSNYSYYSKTTGACSYSTGNYASCTYSDPSLVRVCQCNLNNGAYSNNFDFQFVAP